jgi:8-hydroxy-5-deazaflavin:NADPH oxidoreductase
MPDRKHLTTVVTAALLILFGAPTIAGAETIAVIGTGEVGSALGPEFAALGHTIVYGSREPQRDDVRDLVSRTGERAAAALPEVAAAEADIIVLAVPGLLVGETTRSLGDLEGKTIIDPTNALQRGDDGQLEMSVDTSNAEIIQAAAPDADVVKAFNTLNWRQMVEPDTSGGPVSVPLVGNSAAAKAKVAGLVEGLGLEPIDLGSVKNARHVEGMLILWINNRSGNRQAFDYHLRAVGAQR